MLVIFLFASLALGQSTPRVETSVLCGNAAGEAIVRFKGTLFLNEAFLNQSVDRTEQILKAIHQQLHYVSGFFENNRTSGHAVVFSFDDRAIESLDISQFDYPLSYTIDDLQHSEYKTDNEYQLKAITAGKTTANSPGVKVSYLARLQAALCSPDDKFPSEIEFAIPADPYLIYWAVPKEKRRLIQWRNSSWTINPCASSELADLPHPLHYWYFWNPTQKDKDSKGENFDCSTLMKSSVDYFSVKASLEKIKREISSPLSSRIAEHWRQKKKIDVTFIQGVINREASLFPISQFAKALGGAKSNFTQKLVDFFVSNNLYPDRWDINDKSVDQGSGVVLGVLRDLPWVLKVENSTVTQKNKSLDLVLEGKLIRSKTPVRMRFFFGHTDTLSPEEPTHWPVLLEGLKKSDLVIYAGHSRRATFFAPAG